MIYIKLISRICCLAAAAALASCATGCGALDKVSEITEKFGGKSKSESSESSEESVRETATDSVSIGTAERADSEPATEKLETKPIVATSSTEAAVSETKKVEIVPRLDNFYGSIIETYGSSQLDDEMSYGELHTYSPYKVVDGDFSTCWSEGAGGYGENEYITIVFDKIYAIDEICIWNGLCTNEELFYKNSRLCEIEIELSDGQTFSYECQDGWENRKNTVTFSDSVKTSSVTITIKSVYAGNKYSDTCISEISVS